MPPKKSIKNTVTVSKHDSDTEDDSSSSDDNITTKHSMVNKKAAEIKAEAIEDDSEDTGDISDHNSESDSDSESDDNQDKKSKEKKLKESFEELTKKDNTLQLNIKTIDKEILEMEKTIKIKKKLRSDYERQRNLISKLSIKAHTDEVSKAQKGKVKRTNTNTKKAGFNS